MRELSTGRRPPSASRYDSWTILGPGGGGTMIEPIVSPHDPNVAIVYSDMTGAYITYDGGLSWRMFNLRCRMSSFAFDPHHAEIIYAGNAALWRSENTGRTWKMIFPDPTKSTRERRWNDHAECVFITDDLSYPSNPVEVEIQAITVDPKDSNRVYLGLSSFVNTERSASLLFSHERGKTWSHVITLAGNRVCAIYLQETTTDECGMYVVGETGVYVGYGNEWAHYGGPTKEKIQFAAMGSGKEWDRPFIYVIAPDRSNDGSVSRCLYASQNGGKDWYSAELTLPETFPKSNQDKAPEFTAIACCAMNGATAYAGFKNLRLGEGLENVFNGIARTTDGGLHWRLVHCDSNTPSINMDHSWVEARTLETGPGSVFHPPRGLEVCPTNEDVCYATDCFRTYHTQNGGVSWQQDHSVNVGDRCWTTRGLDVTTCYGVHFDPFDENRIFITYTDIGLFVSSDRGASWRSSIKGIPRKWRNTTYWIALDPQVKGLMWGAFSAIHDLPRPKSWRAEDPENFDGGIAVSLDGGLHWKVSNEGMDPAAVTHIILDPNTNAGKRTLYACAFGRGVYKSVDNGKSWKLKNNGIEMKSPFAWRVTLADDRTLYLVIARRSEHGRIGDADDGAVYKSPDGGESWKKLELPPGTNGPTSLIVDPHDNNRMYLTAWGVAKQTGDTGGGVFVSTNCGSRWENIFDESQHIYDLTIDPKDPQTLYICGFDSSAHRSTDAGKTWTRIKGYSFQWGHRVILDPMDQNKIYITTYGGSVWHGPAAGDPCATADIEDPAHSEK